MKGKSRPRTFEEVDVDLENAIDEFRRVCQRINHGQVGVRVTKLQGLVIGQHVDFDDMTPMDVQGLMIEKPGAWRR